MWMFVGRCPLGGMTSGPVISRPTATKVRHRKRAGATDSAFSIRATDTRPLSYRPMWFMRLSTRGDSRNSGQLPGQLSQPRIGSGRVHDATLRIQEEATRRRLRRPRCGGYQLVAHGSTVSKKEANERRGRSRSHSKVRGGDAFADTPSFKRWMDDGCAKACKVPSW